MGKANLIVTIGDGDYYAVDGNFEPGKKFKKDHMYIVNGNELSIYGGRLKGEELPGHFYRTSKDPESYKFIPPNKDQIEEFMVGNITDTTLAKRAITNPDDFKDVDVSQVDTTELKIFAPPIKPNDDVLKRIIKTALIQKQVDLKLYRGQFDKDYHLSNLKSTLTKDAPLSAKYFVRWCEILGLSVTVLAEDNGLDKIAPLTEKIECEYS